MHAWSRVPSLRGAIWPGVLIGAATYLRAEYLALAVIFGAIVLYVGGRKAAGQARQDGGR